MSVAPAHSANGYPPAPSAGGYSATALASVDGGAAALAPTSLAGVEIAHANTTTRKAHRVSNILRRALDVVVAGGLLIVLSPLLLALFVAVRLDSSGPAFFRQQRVGRGRREFTTLKFRTMYADADATPHREYVQALIGDDRGPERGRLYKLSIDDRVTRTGRFLRSWSLDELPQLINVLVGQMALVGPRPVIPYEVEMYPETYLGRFDVKPGLTGLWQVSGRNERTYEEMVKLDVQYAHEASLLLDLRILAKTLPVVLRRQGVA